VDDASLDDLEERRAHLYEQLAATGDFRRGSISENYRRRGKPNCACAQPDHPGACLKLLRISAPRRCQIH